MFRFPSIRNDGKKNRTFYLMIINTYKLPGALSDPLYLLPLALSWGVSPDDIFILIDGSVGDPRFNLLKGLIGKNNTFVCFSQPGGSSSNFINCYSSIIKNIQSLSKNEASSLFISISGHGTQIRDTNGDEPTGFDDAIIPGGIVVRDDELRKGLEGLKDNFTVLTIADTCHSGTMFDFDYEVTPSSPLGGNFLNEQKVGNSKGTLLFDGISLSACADHQVDYEVGISYGSRLLPYLDRLNLTQSQKNQYANLMRQHTTTGALTGAICESCTESVDTNSIKKVVERLKPLGQKCQICKTLSLKIRDGSLSLIDIKNDKVRASTNADTTREFSIDSDGDGVNDTDSDPPSGNNPPSNGIKWWVFLIILIGILFVCVILAIVCKYYVYTPKKVVQTNVV